jgi:hypothetical protein
MEDKKSQVKQVRTHLATSNQPQTANQKEGIPGGCIRPFRRPASYATLASLGDVCFAQIIKMKSVLAIR